MTATEPPGFQRSLYFIFRDPYGHTLLSHPPHISRCFTVGRTAKSGPVRIISEVCAPTPTPTDSAGPSQGESGQKDTDDAASTMSHDVTVRSHPRHTGWGFLPLPRSLVQAIQHPGTRRASEAAEHASTQPPCLTLPYQQTVDNLETKHVIRPHRPTTERRRELAAHYVWARRSSH